MKEHPILFSGPMIRALLDGRKTQTRRVVKPQPESVFPSASGAFVNMMPASGTIAEMRCPYGDVGTLLWVRETFRPVASGGVKNRYGEVRYGFAYRADDSVRWQPGAPTIIHDLTDRPKDTGPLQFQPGLWKPGIHMPRRACRLKLRITEVRVQRLQEIGDSDALAEGIEEVAPATYRNYAGHKCPADAIHAPTASYRSLWESINGKGSWDENPWVWAITFERAA